MKSINTYLTERQFLNRLEQLPQSKDCLSDKCGESGLYVYNINGNRFWLGKYAYKSRSYGFLPTRLNCKYEIGENGYIVVLYQRAKHISSVIFQSLLVMVGILFFIYNFIDLLKGFKYDNLFFLIAILISGLYGLLIKPNKDWNSLLALLYDICDNKNNNVHENIKKNK